MNEELPELKKVRGRTEAPSKPDFFDANLLLIGGKNPFGEPNLRVDWGWDCRTFRNNNPEALAYPGPFLDRWILQKWIEPSFFGSRRHWNEFRWQKTADGKSVDLLGEFPSRGRYGMVMPLTNPDGAYIPLGSEVLQFIQQMWSQFQARTLNVYSDAKMLARLQEQMTLEEEKLEAQVVEEARDFEEHVLMHEDEINKNPVQFFRPGRSLWTPEGERPLVH